MEFKPILLLEKNKKVLTIKTLELNNRDNSLNLLRLVFASFVLIGHTFGFIGVQNTLPTPVTYILNLAVPCFFVVSGYLITASAIKNGMKTFFKKRFARIYPAYFVCLIVIIVLFAPIAHLLQFHSLGNYLTQSPTPLKFFISNLPLFMVCPQLGQTLTVISGSSWNGSAWTLIFEFGCYIAIATIIKLLIKFRQKHLFKIVFGIYLLLIVFSLFYPRPEGNPQRNVLNLVIFAVNLFSIFLGGSLIYLIKDKIIFNLKYLILAIVFCIIVMSILRYAWATEICAIPMTYIILYISVKLKSSKFIQENDISYGVYIYAWPVQTLIAIILAVYGIVLNVWVYTVICFIVTCIFASLSWFLLEKPILKRVR